MKQNLKFIAIALLGMLVIYSCNQDIDLVTEQSMDEIEQEQILRSCGHEAHMSTLMQDEEYRNRRQELMLNLKEESVSVESRALCNNPTIVPVAVHYQGISNPDEGCLVSLAQSQVNILNEDFQGRNSDISSWISNAPYFNGITNGETCIEFVLADQNHPSGYGISNGDPSVTINKTSGDTDPNWSGYVNFFIQSNTGLLGYSPLGGEGNGDGVVIDANAFGSGTGCGSISPSSPYNLGRTLTHELGHYLNLDHIWASSGCGNTDDVNDTPNQNSENYGCPTVPVNSCGSNDLSMNYMDYTNDACMYMFTAGQSSRMENWVIANLANVVSNASQVISGGSVIVGGDNGSGTDTGSDDGSNGGSDDTNDGSGDVCTVPSGVSATVNGASSITIKWNAEPDAIKYRVRYRQAGTTTWKLKTVTNNSALLANLLPGTNYQYRVRTRCQSGWTPYSVRKTVSTAESAPEPEQDGPNTIKLQIKLDEYPEETTWELVDNNGYVVSYGGPFALSQSNKLVTKTLSIPNGQYTLYVDDTYGDGICCDYGNGYVRLKDIHNKTFASSNGNYGYYAELDFEIYGDVAQFSADYSDRKAQNIKSKTRESSKEIVEVNTH